MTFSEKLREYSAPAELCAKSADGRLRCLACAHRCAIPPGEAGICGVRFNDSGVLMAPWGYISSAGLDPVEKKPFFHALPGALTFSFGMLGCNFKCSFCQNHELSRQGKETFCGPVYMRPAGPAELAAEARGAGAALIVSTYNEPLITAEWSAAVFKEAGKYGIRGAFVSNGYASEEALDYIRPHTDLYKADLKTFDADSYSVTAGGRLDRVLEGIEMAYEKGFWLEIVTLLIPGFNDSPGELDAIAGYIAGLSPCIPWHITAFHPDHRMTDRGPASADSLLAARERGLRKGLKYVYTGNIPGAGAEDTRCPACQELLIARRGFSVLENSVKVSSEGTGSCRKCREAIPGLWK